MSRYYRYKFDHQSMLEQVTSAGECEVATPCGAMKFSHIHLDDGLNMMKHQGQFNRAVELWSDDGYHQPVLSFFVNLGSACECFMECVNKRFIVPSKKIVVYYSPESQGYTRLQQSHLNGLSVNLALEQFRHMVLEDQQSELLKRFEPLLKPNPDPFFLLLDATPDVLDVVTRLNQIKGDSFCNRLKLRGLSWQLCGEVIHQVYQQQGGCRCRLSQGDIQKVKQARDILVSKMENPPTLLELAHQVGMNDFKLKQGFKAVYQQTAFGFLTEYRMEQAKAMLADGNHKVIHVANEVGYRNHGHFSAAFRKHFGQSPRDYVKTVTGKLGHS